MSVRFSPPGNRTHQFRPGKTELTPISADTNFGPKTPDMHYGALIVKSSGKRQVHAMRQSY